MNKSIEFLKSYLKNNDTVVCACSGGPDSMVLINLLLDLEKKYNLKIICAHVNHSLREESKEEYEFVKKFCKNNNIIFEGIILSNYEGNIENDARNKRYTFFEDIVKKYNAKYLLTAHHGDDLIETILMKIARGSSLDGYIGFDFSVKKDNYVLLRPLVFYTKKDIEIYAKEKNIEYRIDKTNFDKKYTRNRYRMNILPLLKEENKNIHLKYLKFSEELKENNEFINRYIGLKYNEVINNNKILINLLKEEDPFVIKKIIYLYLKNIYKEKIKYIESKHIDYIIKLINSNRPNLSINLPLDIILSKNYDYLFINSKDNFSNYKYELKDSIKVPYGTISIVKDTNLTNNYVCFLDSKSIKLPLYVRNKKEGDLIILLGLNKTKKIKDIFINEKMEYEKRKDYPIVVDSEDNILWIPGLKKSIYDNIKTGKYDIILKYDEEEKNE